MVGHGIERNFRALSLFRIVFSIYLLGDFLTYYSCCFRDFYGETGVLPSAAFYADPTVAPQGVLYAFVALMDYANVPLALPVAYPIGIVCFAIGAWTRLSNLVVLLLNSYLYFRNPYIMSGADSLARLMLVWCLFLPLNRHWSIDSLYDLLPRDREYPALPFFSIKAQVCSVYVVAALTKLAGGPWREGEAVIWVLSDNIWGGSELGLYLVEHFSWLLRCANYLIVAFQLSFPLLIASPWSNNLTRGAALLGAAAMHTSFIVFLNIGNFPFVSLAILLVLVPDAWLRHAWGFVRARVAAISHYALPVVSTGLAGSARGALGLPGAWLLARGPLRRPFGDTRSGQAIAFSATALSGRAHYRPDLWLCGFLTLLAAASNIHSIARISDTEVPAEPPAYLRELDKLAFVFQVAQRWYLFAPVPTHFFWDYRIVARGVDGSARDFMDVLTSPLLRKRADRARVEFAAQRWLKYFSNFGDFTANSWSALGRYLCRRAQSDVVGLTGPIHAVEIIASRKAIEFAASRDARTIQQTFECTP